MKRIATAVVALGLAAAGSAALADPVQMNDAQLDAVAAGQVQVTDGLVNVTVGDVSVDVPVRVLNNSVNNNTVQVPVAANVNAVVAALGNAAGLAQQLGRQTQN